MFLTVTTDGATERLCTPVGRAGTSVAAAAAGVEGKYRTFIELLSSFDFVQLVSVQVFSVPCVCCWWCPPWWKFFVLLLHAAAQTHNKTDNIASLII